jgi:hypothetical protein
VHAGLPDGRGAARGVAWRQAPPPAGGARCPYAAAVRRRPPPIRRHRPPPSAGTVRRRSQAPSAAVRRDRPPPFAGTVRRRKIVYGFGSSPRDCAETDDGGRHAELRRHAASSKQIITVDLINCRILGVTELVNDCVRSCRILLRVLGSFIKLCTDLSNRLLRVPIDPVSAPVRALSLRPRQMPKKQVAKRRAR